MVLLVKIAKKRSNLLSSEVRNYFLKDILKVNLILFILKTVFVRLKERFEQQYPNYKQAVH